MKKIILLLLTVVGFYQVKAQIDYNYQINGLSVTFVITQQGQFYEGVTWDYGDGNTSQGTNEMEDTVTHVYSSIGNYTVCVVGYPMPMAPNDTACKFVDVLYSGINQIEKNSIIEIYPNPSSNIITVKVNNELVGSNYSITDNLGRTVLKGKLFTENTNISINEIDIGFYLFQVEEQKMQTLKVMKK